MEDGNSQDFTIPKKIGAYLKRLKIEYERSGNVGLSKVVDGARIKINIAVDYDNWDGGQHGHAVTLYLPPEVLGEIPLAKQDETANKLRDDLAAASRAVRGEYVSAVYLEMEDENDPNFQSATRPFAAPSIDPSHVPFWKPDHLRLFISHRDAHKAVAHQFASVLNGFGISSFVAHDQIGADLVWQAEIEKALNSMEAVLALITDDFFDSPWTNQEIGFALGKGIPVVPVRLGLKAPQGFLSHKQAPKVQTTLAGEEAIALVLRIATQTGGTDRMKSGLVTALINARSWADAARNFDNLAALGPVGADDAERIMGGYAANQKLNSAFYLSKSTRLTDYLSTCTGQQYRIDKRKNILVEAGPADEIPY